MNLLEQKKQLRKTIKQQRSMLSKADRTKMSQQINQFLDEIPEFNQAKSIFCYISYLSEVETRPLISAFLEQKLSMAVPKIIGKTEMLAVPLTDLSELEPDKMGILTPKTNQAVPDPFDIAITPGLGFTERGERLGYGRGYYDRWFANNKVKTKIGVAFELQIVDDLPLEDTDMPLDILVTEKRIIDLRSHS
ncbi:MAG: 5-formyltetrahydrofolate cyclo-ligase [Proteobacteria bacterium]|nr:5-formyltetrahydrofolate cyclo-ligase [Pseudomonadota bacterium]NOG59196.1 5-formyltetrahydrofolate cyclo-ligase [Pseudomonadota bacterium]